jgi:glycosyltransferase involved in cell wall biosynthesis
VKKILFVGWGLPAGGGAERQWSLLIRAVRAAGFEVSLLTLVEEGVLFHELRREGVSATCVRMRHRTDLIRLRHALHYAALRPDVVVTQSINAHMVGQRIALKARAAHVATEHAAPGPLSSQTLHRRALARLVAPRVDAVVAVSRAQLPRLLRLGYRRERVHIIPNAVPEPTPRRAAAATRSLLDVSSEQFLAVVVASLRSEKRVEVFIRAVEIARRSEPRIVGLVVGGGSELERMRALADANGGGVRLLGHRDDVAEIFAASDVACLSSIAEANPLSLLEAMAAGKPVVATDVGGISEIVEDEKTGLLVPSGDADRFASALLRLAKDPALAVRMGVAGAARQRALFSIERMVSDYVRLFEGVSANGHRHSGPSRGRRAGTWSGLRRRSSRQDGC